MPEESYVELSEDESFSVHIMHGSASTSTMNSTSTENKLNNDSASAIDKLEGDSNIIERTVTDDSAPGENKMRLEEDAGYDTNNPEEDSTSSDERSLQGMKEDSAPTNKLENDSASEINDKQDADLASTSNNKQDDDDSVKNNEEDSASAINSELEDGSARGLQLLRLEEDTESAKNKLEEGSTSVEDKLIDDSYDTLEADSDGGEKEPTQEKRTVQVFCRC